MYLVEFVIILNGTKMNMQDMNKLQLVRMNDNEYFGTQRVPF